MSVDIAHISEGTNTVILTSGDVITLSDYRNNPGNCKVVGKLKNTDVKNVYSIIDVNTGKVIAFYNDEKKHIFKQDTNAINLNSVNTGGIVLNGGTSTGIISGAVHTGGVVIGGGDKQPAPIVAPIQQVEVSRQEIPKTPLEGYEFNPIPTDYTDIEIQNLGNFYKYKIIIKKGDNNMNTKAHSDIYDGLTDEAKSTESLVAGGYPDIVNLNHMNALLGLDVILADSKNKYNLVSGSRSTVVLKGLVKSKAPISENTVGVSKLSNGNALVNEYVQITYDSTSVKDILTQMLGHYNEDALRVFVPYFGRIFYEELQPLDTMGLKPNFNPFVYGLELISVIETMEDIEEKAAHIAALDRITTRLKLDKSTDLEYEFEQYGVKDKVVTASGLSERVLVVTVRDDYIVQELAKYIRDNTDGMFKISNNTPNTLKLVSSIFNGAIKLSGTTDIFNIKNFADVNHVLVLVVKNRMFTVVNKNNNYVIFNY